MEGEDETESVVVARQFGVEYLCSDGNWYTGKSATPSDTLAIHECRTRWKAGALGVRVVEFRKTIVQQRIREP